MRILLAGPKLCTPWTEGRKRFVRDLAAEFARTDEVRVLTTAARGETTQFAAPWEAPYARSAAGHLFRFHRRLGERIARWRPDLVCHFPIGSFHGWYRIGNLASMRWADRQCARRAVPCFTVMYSITGGVCTDDLRSRVRHLLVNQSAASGTRIRFGIALRPPAPLPPLDTGKRLLFMTGLAQASPERLDHALNLRGLGTLLEAGRWLAPAGFRLSIAIPFLADPEMRRALLRTPRNAWPPERIELRVTVGVPDVFAGHELYVFPYAREEPQFVPTSVVEAMEFGLPVVLADHRFLQPLIRGGRTAFAFAPDDPEALARAVLAASADPARREAVRRQAVQLVREELDIRASCADILARYRAVASDAP